MIGLRKYLGFMAIGFLIISMAVFVNGCSQSKEGEKKPAQATGEKATPPPALKTLLTDLEKVLKDLEMMIKQEKEPSSSQSSQSGGGSEQSQGQSSEQQDGGGNQQSGKDQGDSGGSNTDPQKAWADIEKTVTNIHRDWNMLEAEAMKQGMDTVTRDSFEQALAHFTVTLEQKIPQESLFAVLDVYKYYPDLVELFENKVPADFYRVKYEVMMIRAQASREEWIMAGEHISKMKTAWGNLKKDEKLKNEKDMVKQTENSLEDIELGVEMEDTKLVEIKGSIALDNLDKVEGVFTSQS